MQVYVLVETFEIFTYICAGKQLSNNLFPHLPWLQPLPYIKMTENDNINNDKRPNPRKNWKKMVA